MSYFVIKSVAPVAISKSLGHRVCVVPASNLSCETMEDVLDLVYVKNLERHEWEHEIREVSKEEWEAAICGKSNGYTKTGKLADFYLQPWSPEDMYT